MSDSPKRILVVDPDRKSRRILEASLRKAGYDCASAETARGAVELLRRDPVELIIAETELPDASGFDLCRQVKAQPSLEHLPFIFLTHSGDMADKLRGFELGVEDYIQKPAYVREVSARVALLLQRREKELLAEAEAYTVSGHLDDISLVDIFQTIEDSGKTGALRLEREDRRATVYFQDGLPVDAKAGLLVGEEAVYRLFAWPNGDFTIKYLPSIRRPRRIDLSFTDLILQGLQRSEQFEAVTEEFGPPSRLLRVDYKQLATKVAELPGPVTEILHLFDGRRPLGELVEDSPLGDLATMRIVRRLHQEGLLEDVSIRPGDEADDFESLAAASAESELGSWLKESETERAEREERERQRRDEERRLREELDKLKLLRTDLAERLQAAEDARRAAQEASAALRDRERAIRERLTGDLPIASTDELPITKRPTPSRDLPSADAGPRRVTDPDGEEVMDWLGLTTDADLIAPEPADGGRVDTFDYPALKVPDEAATPPGERSRTGARRIAKDRDRVDTNPRFRSDMAADPATGEIRNLRRSLDDERRRIEQARRRVRREEEHAGRSARDLEEAKRAYDEQERLEDLQRLQSKQIDLERARQNLIDQRERLQAELAAERDQLVRERRRLQEAAERRKHAQQAEEDRLRQELEQARLEREAEERRLAQQREEARRLQREVEAEQQKLVARSQELERVAQDPEGEPDPSVDEAERRVRAVEEARRRLLDAARRSGQAPDDDADGSADHPASIDLTGDTGDRLASLVNEARMRRGRITPPPIKSAPTRQAEDSARPTPTGGVPIVEPFKRSTSRVERDSRSLPPAIPVDARRQMESEAGVPPEAGAVSSGDSPRIHARLQMPRVDPSGEAAVAGAMVLGGGAKPLEPADLREVDAAEGTGKSGDDEALDAFFRQGDDDIYDALYADEPASTRGRKLLWGVAAFLAAFAVAFLISSVTGDDGEINASNDQAGAEPEATVSDEELAAWRQVAQDTAHDGVEGVVADATSVAVTVRAEELGADRAFDVLAVVAPVEQLEALPLEDSAISAVLPEGAAPATLDGLAAQPAADTTAAAETADEQPDEDDEEQADVDDDIARARRALEEAEAEDEEERVDTDRAMGRARGLIGDGDYGEAAAELRQIVQQESGNRTAHQLLGRCLLELGDINQAVTHLERATRSRRPNDEALLMLGSAQIEAGDTTAANQTFQRYLELYPNNDEAQNVREFLGL